MSKEDNANLKIADFGFARKHDANSDVLRAQCGTPGCEILLLYGGCGYCLGVVYVQ